MNSTGVLDVQEEEGVSAVGIIATADGKLNPRRGSPRFVRDEARGFLSPLRGCRRARDRLGRVRIRVHELSSTEGRRSRRSKGCRSRMLVVVRARVRRRGARSTSNA